VIRRKINHLEDLNLGGRIILRWILKIYDGRVWSGFTYLKERLSESPVSIKICDFLTD
jgi:hypothetical protein